MQIPFHLASDLLATSLYGGNSLLLVQASGGNNSVKSNTGDVIWIKASGTRLAKVSTKQGLATLRLSALKELVARDSAKPKPDTTEARRMLHEDAVRQIQGAMLQPGSVRASMETGFHSLLGDVVLHLHPVYLNAFTCMDGGREMLADIAPQEFTWIDYTAPGQELAVRMHQAEKARSCTECDCYVLENHGFVASAQNAKQVVAATEQFLNIAQIFFGDLAPDFMVPRPPSKASQEAADKLSALYRERWSQAKAVIRPARFGAFNQLDSWSQLFETPGALVPDDVVYGGGEIHRSSLRGLSQLIGSLPDATDKLAVAVEGAGTILLASTESLATAMEEMLLAHILIRMLVARRGSVRTLPRHEVEYLQSMESEKYRLMVRARGAS
jgi:rhamnose utilization protein RhaD (predicted bifunctional aldolase and dehydrogenase)